MTDFHWGLSGEKKGFAIDGGVRATSIVANIFIGAALLGIAKKTALPNGNLSWAPIKADSLIAIMSTVGGLCGAVFMPIVGAIVDHSEKRWHIGFGSVLLLCLINMVQVIVSEDTWVFIAVLQLFAGFCYTTHLVVVYAYLPELSNDPEELNRINSITNTFVYLGQFVFLFTAIVLSFITGAEDVGQARISQVMVSVIGLIGYNYTWMTKMKNRPALNVMDPNASYLTFGFRKISKTLHGLKDEFKPVLTFLVSITCAEAATAAFVSIAVTYTTAVLEMEVKETGILIALVIFFAIPGSLIFRKVTNKIGLHESYMLALFYWFSVTAISPIFMNEPSQSGNR